VTVDLKEGETQVIDPAFVQVSVDPSVSLELSSSLLGTPLYVELNKSHWLDLNRTYPVLPGKATLKLNGSQSEYNIELTSGTLLEKKTRSLIVSFDCSPWEWSCLGKHKIYLYNTDKAYHFTEGVSDVPILFFEEDVWVSIQGSRDIRYQLDPKKRNFKLKVGEVIFKPQYVVRANHLTDLSRVEAVKQPYSGHTLDIPIERDVKIPLIAGAYHLAQYTSIYNNEYERKSSKRWFHVKAFETLELNYQIIVKEEKINSLKKSLEKYRQRHRKKTQVIARQFEPIIPFQIE
jgi:hypothetical protein